MSRLPLQIAIAVVGLAVVAGPARAQRRMRGGHAVVVVPPAVGVRLGYDFDIDHVFVGGQLDLPVGQRVALVPAFELYPGATGSPYRLNVGLKYHPPTVYGFFYLGGGFTYLHASGAGNAGGNVFAGWEGRRARPFRPFLEGKFTFVDHTAFSLEAGINFPL